MVGKDYRYFVYSMSLNTTAAPIPTAISMHNAMCAGSSSPNNNIRMSDTTIINNAARPNMNLRDTSVINESEYFNLTNIPVYCEPLHFIAKNSLTIVIYKETMNEL